MFKCQKCQKSSRQRFTVVQSGRSVAYTNILIGYSNTKERQKEAQGWEIEQETALCSDCYQKHGSRPALIKNTGKHVTHVFHKR